MRQQCEEVQKNLSTQQFPEIFYLNILAILGLQKIIEICFLLQLITFNFIN